MGVRNRLSLIALWLWLVAWVPALAQVPEVSESGKASEAELDLSSYRAALSRISEAVKKKQNLRNLQESLPPSWTVRTKDEKFDVSTREISEALADIERDPSKSGATAGQLESRLNSLQRAAVELESIEAKPSSKKAEGKLHNILGRSEFQEAAGPSAMDRLRARINRWVLEHLIRLLNRIHISARTGNYVSWGLIVLVVVALFYVFYRWLSQGGGEVRFKAESNPIASDVRHWLQEALRAAERGDYREAIHCGYWASVARLEDTRFLPRDRTRTPRESLRLLDQHPREQGFLRTVTQNFEPIWYGYRSASQKEWATTKEQLEKMGCPPDLTEPTARS